MKRIGFIGLGQMGYPMASNLNKKLGDKLVSFSIMDVSSEPTTRFKKYHDKVQVFSTPVQVAEESDVVITMLPSHAHVNQVYTAKEGLLRAKAVSSRLFVDSSTIDPETCQTIAEKTKSTGQTMVDAPVSGGTLGAEAATLTFMVGSEGEQTFNNVKPILQLMGKNIVYCGPNGHGQIAKIANNMLLGISMIGAAEAMNLGTRLGMDPKLLANIINTSSGRCWSTDTYNPYPGVLPNVPANRDYKGGFANALIAKDLGLAVQCADKSKSTITLGALAHQLYKQLSQTEGFKDKDFSSIFKWLNDNSSKFK